MSERLPEYRLNSDGFYWWTVDGELVVVHGVPEKEDFPCVLTLGPLKVHCNGRYCYVTD